MSYSLDTQVGFIPLHVPFSQRLRATPFCVKFLSHWILIMPLLKKWTLPFLGAGGSGQLSE